MKKKPEPDLRNKNLKTIRSAWLADAASLNLLSQASYAFALIARAFESSCSRPVFWLPEYFCNDALKPLRAADANIVVYPLTQGLDPDWEACEALARSAPPAFFVLVHFFGRLADAGEARHFCDRHGAKLIEDAAHVLLPAGVIGAYGDFVCFSPRKFLEIPDGGLLIVRDAGDGRAIDEALASVGLEYPNPMRWRMRRWERFVRRRILRRRKPPSPLAPMTVSEACPAIDPFPQPRISPFAQRMMARQARPDTLAKISSERRHFEAYVANIISNARGVTVIPRDNDVVSCVFGMTCEDEAVSQAALNLLRSEGISASPWPNQLPPEGLCGPRRQKALAMQRTTLIAVPK